MKTSLKQDETIAELNRVAGNALQYVESDEADPENVFSPWESIMDSIRVCETCVSRKNMLAIRKITSILEEVSKATQLNLAAFRIELIVKKYIKHDSKYDEDSDEEKRIEEIFLALEEILEKTIEARQVLKKNGLDDQDIYSQIYNLMRKKVDDSRTLLREYQRRYDDLLIPLMNRFPWAARYYASLAKEFADNHGTDLSVEEQVRFTLNLNIKEDDRINEAAFKIRYSLDEYTKYVLWKDLNDGMFFQGNYPPGVEKRIEKAFYGEIPDSDLPKLQKIYKAVCPGIHANKIGMIVRIAEGNGDKRKKLVEYAKFVDGILTKKAESLNQEENSKKLFKLRTIYTIQWLKNTNANNIPKSTIENLAEEICGLWGDNSDLSDDLSPFTATCIFEESDLRNVYAQAVKIDSSSAPGKVYDFISQSVSTAMKNNKIGVQNTFAEYLKVYDNQNDGLCLISKKQFKEIISNGGQSHINALKSMPTGSLSKKQMFIVGFSYEIGLFGNVDQALADSYYAANQGCGRSLNNLAYREEHQPAHDLKKAFDHYKEAATGFGIDEAYYNVGRFLENGLGTTAKDEKEALNCYEKASKRGYEPAIEAMKRLNGQKGGKK